MGTQQYGDDASLTKKQSKMVKVVTTTTGKLGVRIGGMQVYQVTTQSYLCRNKYYGRSVTVSTFLNALREFLHNGAKLRLDVLPPLIQRLEELAGVLKHEESARFYTTSLLLLYDGKVSENATSYDFDVSKIQGLDRDDVRRTQRDSNSSSNSIGENIRGRRSSSAEDLTAIEEKHFKELLTLDAPPKPGCHHHRRAKSSTTTDDVRVSNSSSFDTPLNSPLPPEPMVDVRIIDFAHSTHKGLDDTVIYTGPDRGFLLGLDNMISFLKGIERDHG